jgi:hypothetical protein
MGKRGPWMGRKTDNQLKQFFTKLIDFNYFGFSKAKSQLIQSYPMLEYLFTLRLEVTYFKTDPKRQISIKVLIS